MEHNERFGSMTRKLAKKELNQKEFQRDCALWLLDKECWDSLNPCVLPPKTKSIYQYEKEYSGKKVDSAFYREDPIGQAIIEYVSLLHYRYFYNIEIIKHLNFLKSHLIEQKYILPYNIKISEFYKQAKFIQEELVNYLPQNIRYKFTDRHKDGLVKELVDEFEGEVQ